MNEPKNNNKEKFKNISSNQNPLNLLSNNLVIIMKQIIHLQRDLLIQANAIKIIVKAMVK